jgi:RNA polymerase sigma factor (sigma-70 family)
MASPSCGRLVSRVDSSEADHSGKVGREALLETYLARRLDLIRFFTLRLRSAAAAEDLVQDIYLRLQTVTDAHVQNPTGYLYRLGSNLMLDRLRGERRSASRDAAWRDSHHTLIGAEEVSEEPTADRAVAARQRLDATIAALKDLPPQTQSVFWKHKFEGLTHPEVAAALGISRSSVEKHVMAALRHLAERLR